MPPAPGMPLPPNPAMPLPPNPSMPLPPNPTMPLPAPEVMEEAVEKPAPVEALPPAATTVIEPEPEEESYQGLYARKSGKPLKQVYGHIERIGTGEIGSLLDRYADRFGHELDRDIIVMRQAEREDKMTEIRDSPTVELLNAEEDESHLDSETLVELNSQLKSVEDELRRLKPEYQTAKEENNRPVLRELRPTLEALMNERKMIQSVIAGEASLDDLLESEGVEEEDVSEEDHDVPDEEVEEEVHIAEEADDDMFLTFVSIVDNLLGSNLPEDKIDEFTKSEGFSVYRSVGSDPSNASEEERSEFFKVVDSLLGGMPDDAVAEFVESADFDTYRAIGAMYS